MKLLLSGDLHLGRSPTRLPPEWTTEARAVRAWERIVDFAVREDVDAVVLSGDLVDKDNRFWEAIGPLELGLRRLAECGVRCFAVAGNHDAEVLPRLAATLPAGTLHLLGAGGSWETVLLHHDGHPALRLCGWSFPYSRVVFDPTRDFPELPADGVPTLAVVHGDPDSPASPYAPLQTSRLRSLPVSGWLLGHVHKPNLSEGTPWILMPGPPQPLDPSETGPHHAWLCELHEGRLTLPRPACPAAFLYASIDLTLTRDDLPTEALLRERILAQKPPGNTSIRLRILGETRDPEALARCLEYLPDWRGNEAFISSIQNCAHPAIDLAIARASGPVPALIADAITQPPPELLRRIRDASERIQRQREFAELPALDDAEIDLVTPLYAILHALREDHA